MNTNEKSANVRFVIDFINKTIIGTKASFHKAGKGYGPEYEELAEKMAKHPNFELVIKEQKNRSKKAKKTYSGLNFSFMEAYISTQENAKVLMIEYQEIKKTACSLSEKPYPTVKKWFLNKFDTEAAPFDMKKARDAIYQFNTAQAKENALPLRSSQDLPVMKAAV